jgi:lysophospholipase L1-like esterase
LPCLGSFWAGRQINGLVLVRVQYRSLFRFHNPILSWIMTEWAYDKNKRWAMRMSPRKPDLHHIWNPQRLKEIESMFFQRFLSKYLLAFLTLAVVPVFAGNNTNFTYLALGDSVSFGFDPTLLVPGQPLPRPDKFKGYPEVVADSEHLSQSKKEINASCPGETSASFLDTSIPDNGCNSPHLQPPLPPLPGFKTTIGLHTNYTESQVAFAVSQLASNKHIDIVTLSIGGNDLLLVENNCTGASNFADCVHTQLTAVLPAYGNNLAQILTAIRAHYAGTLVLVKYYSPSADPLFLQAVGALNQVMVQVGASFGVKFADGFAAFQLASALFQGDPCAAGLLVRLNATTCDVHPSPQGRDLLAATVLLSMGDKH